MTASDSARYYKIYFTSADGLQWVPASSSTANSATSAKTVNQRPIDPFGRIAYTSLTTSFAAGASLSATAMWDQYNLTLGYSFNTTGEELTLTVKAPIYIKCAPQSDGSAIIDSTTPYVQELPTSANGKIYIFLGIATSATQVELHINHPVYYHDGTGIRLWTGKEIPNQSDIDATKPFIVTVTETTSGNNTTYSANKTFAEITAAITDGREIRAFKDGQCYNLSYYDNQIIEFDYIDSESLYCQQIEINSSNSVIVFTRDLQSLLTFDNVPTANSNNPVKSGGVYTALQEKADKIIIGTLTAQYDANDELTGYTCNKTYSQLTTAFDDGTYVLLHEGNEYNCYLYVHEKTADAITFYSQTTTDMEQLKITISSSDVVSYEQSPIVWNCGDY